MVTMVINWLNDGFSLMFFLVLPFTWHTDTRHSWPPTREPSSRQHSVRTMETCQIVPTITIPQIIWWESRQNISKRVPLKVLYSSCPFDMPCISMRCKRTLKQSIWLSDQILPTGRCSHPVVRWRDSRDHKMFLCISFHSRCPYHLSRSIQMFNQNHPNVDAHAATCLCMDHLGMAWAHGTLEEGHVQATARSPWA